MPGPDTVIVSKIVRLTHKADTSGVVVIGTVYKEQRLKPNILESAAIILTISRRRTAPF